MLPAFRVKGLWPKPRGISKSDGTHPLTGALLPKFENTDTILQLPLNKYDELVAGHPEYRLKYLDEDKDEITIGSEMELATKLEEPTSHSRLVQRSEDPRFYTSIPECMHAFHINNDEEARKLWTFFESSTISRNRAAYKLWTSPQLDPWNKVQALLNEHAYEFMTGYNFEGFNSHYNYLSEAGQKIKAFAAKRDPSVQGLTSTTSPANPRAVEVSSKKIEMSPPKVIKPSQAEIDILVESPQKAHLYHNSKEANTVEPLTHTEASNATLPEDLVTKLAEASDAVAHDSIKMVTNMDDIANNNKDAEKTHVSKDDTFSLTHAKVTKSMASLNDELDKHLETAQALTRMLDQTASPQVESAYQESLQRQLNNQFEMARSATRMMNAVTKNRQSLPSTAPLIPTIKSEIQDKVSTNTVPSQLHSNVSLGFAKYASRSHGDRKSLDKTDPKELDTSPPSQSFGISQPQNHLTDLGMKESREAGMKLRNQLYGSPKPYAGVTEGNIRHWKFCSSDPPKLEESKSSEKIAEPPLHQTSSDTIIPLNKRKSVRFSFPSSARGEWHLDGSFTPGSRNIEPPIILEKATDHSLLEKSNTTTVDDQESESRIHTSLPKDDSDDHTSASLSEDDAVKIRALLKAFDDGGSAFAVAQRYKDNLKANDAAAAQVQPPQVVVTSLCDTIRQASENLKADSVETTITKLWCQAYEGIMSNIDTFTEQLNTHVTSQISREQAAIHTLLAQDRPPVPLENDQIFLDNVRHATDLIILQDGVQQMIARLRDWNATSKNKLAQPGLCSQYRIDIERVQDMIEGLGILGSSANISFQDLFQKCLAVSNSSSTEITEPQLQWIPRRYSSKVDPCDRKPEFDKTNNKQPFSIADINSERNLLIAREQNRLHRQRILAARPLKNVATEIPATAYEHVISGSAPSRVDSFPPRSALPPFLSGQVQYRLHQTEPSTTSYNDVNNDIHNQQMGYAINRSLVPEPMQSGNEPSDVLLQNFPPLIPRRETQQDKLDSAKGILFTSKNLPDLTAASVSSPFFRKDHVYPSIKRHSAPPPRTQTGSILTQQLGTSPGRPSYPYYNQNESALTQQLHASSGVMSHPKSANSLLPSPVSPVATITRSPETPRTPNRYGTWNEDALLPVAEPSPVQDPSSRSSSVPDQIEPASQADPFQLYQDIPEHKDPKTAVRIMNCVEKLKDMGCGNQVDGGDARLVVYAQAAGGNLGAALDIMEEERQAYAEQNDNVGSYYD